ncbi:hypothetical protein CALVIDRAFT_597847 [Calocera viscosa TUFC12733]|uniref:Uncharacterized protein n=1 Tax=Calocera viscosa (strain TUFC12733) TaxID=1330018 RepID=A0A167MWI1_CALVF|nr:hypothetical protein CALVIDRAFT_597847 [Calocera viscosa TUFC12733]
MSPTSNELRASIRYVHGALLDIVRKKDIASLFGRCKGTIRAARENKYKKPDNLDLDLLFVIPKYLKGEGESFVDYTSRIINMLPEGAQEGARRLAEPKARVADKIRRASLAADREQTVVPELVSPPSPNDREKTLAPEVIVSNTSPYKTAQQFDKSSESLLDASDADQMIIDSLQSTYPCETVDPAPASDDLKQWLFDNELADCERILLKLGIQSFRNIQKLAVTQNTAQLPARFTQYGGTAFQWEIFCDAVRRCTIPASAVAGTLILASNVC